MNKKSLAIACVLAGMAFAAAATPVPGTDTSLGTVDYTTDYTPGSGGDVTWLVSASHPKGTFFTDTYDFTLLEGNDVTASAQVVSTNLKTYALTGNSGELQLYAGTFAAGTSLSSYSLVDQVSFGTSGDDSLIDHLAAGNYFFAVEGTTAGAKGGRYYFEVTAVPEPENTALLLAGLCVVGTLARRRKAN